MNTQPTIRILHPKKLIGKSISMSLANNLTGPLWSSFGPYIKDIEGKIGLDKYSLQVYPIDYFKAFNPNAEFVKWALIQVSDFKNHSPELQEFQLDGGLYAVFDHKGLDPSIFQFIYGEWILKSKYTLDNRPHFEVLGPKYKNNDPNSEEEIWIPIAEL